MHSTQRACYILVSLHTASCRHYHRANGALGYNIDELTVSRSWQVLRRVRLCWAILQALDHLSSVCVYVLRVCVFMTEQTLHRLAP